MRKALCVGIDYYRYCGNLGACVSDAKSVADVLRYHENGDKNFHIKTLYANVENKKVPVGIDPLSKEFVYEDLVTGKPVTIDMLREAVVELFDTDVEVALFYFAGHGDVNANGGYLCTSEVADSRNGLPLDEVMKLAGKSRAKNKIIILDSCFSGYAGKLDENGIYCILPENTIILASCTDYSTAADGCFTELMVEALKGGAMSLTGDVTPGGIYSFIDRALGAWDQRPVFKANIKSFISLRKNTPPIDPKELREITTYFPKADYEYPLDPTYEEDKNHSDNKEVNKEHEAIMELFRTYLKHGLLVPVGEKHIYWAAVHSKPCKLTALGKYYHRIAMKEKEDN